MDTIVKVDIDPFTGKPFVVRQETRVIEPHFGGGGGSGTPGPTGPQGPPGVDGDPGPNEVTTTTETDLTGILKGDGANVGVAIPGTDYVEVQAYNYFVYNSGGAQTGNRFNDWSDLMAVLQDIEGEKTIQFEQDETLPSGAYNLANVRLKGNGSEYTAGGYTVTCPTGVTFTSILNFSIESINLKSTSNAPIITTASPFNIRVTTTGHLQSTTAAMISCSGAGQSVISCQNSGRIDNVGYEIVDFTGAAFAHTVVLSFGDNTVILDDVVRSTNPQVLIQVLGTVVGDAANFPTVQNNFNVGFGLDLKLAFAGNLFYDNATSGLVAADVQAAIDEIADPSDVYTVTNDTTDRSFDADAVLLTDVADVLATLIKDLQARSIIG